MLPPNLKLLIIILALPILAFEVWMLIDVIKNPRLTEKAKVIWAVAMFLLHPFVAIYYFFTARTSRP